MSARLSRRGFLTSSAVGALAVTGLPTLAACSSGSGKAAAKGGGAAASARLQLPAFVPAQVPVPDLPGNADGLDAGYLKAPLGLTTSVPSTPGDGTKITALTETFNTPAPPMGQNGYWQELNKRLGSELDLTIVVDDYPSKFNALVASDDLPDLVWFPPNQGLQNVPALLAAKFLDLTPHLSGDAVKKYPNLANLPTHSWKTSVVDGKIYGVTVTYGAFGQVYLVNEDFWAPAGGTAFSSADDFLAKATSLLDAKNNKYVLEPAYYNHLQQFALWHGAPNTWSLAGGKLTHQIETDELAAALEFAVKVYKANLFWPDPNLDSVNEKMASRSLGAYVQSFPGFILDAKQADFKLGALAPFAAVPTAKPCFYHGFGSVGYTAINKKAAGRVETLLNVLNYLAAPFGTKEAEFVNFGVEGTHFTRDANGNPVLTKQGQTEVLTTWQPVSFLMNSPEYLYIPSNPDRTKLIHDFESAALAMIKVNPCLGHYSDTDASKGAGLRKTYVIAALEDVITGKRPLSDLDAIRKEWRAKGGDAVRGEYEKALAAA